VIPLVLLDLDGTIIGSSGQVQDCVWQAAERVRTAGVKLAVCTGRPLGGVAQRVAERLGPNLPHIFQSGALIAYPDGRTLQVSALKEAHARRLIAHARELGLVLELYSPNALYIERKTPMSEAHAKLIGVSAIVRELYDVAENEPIIRAQWVVPEDRLGEVLALELKGSQVSVAGSPALKHTAFASITQAGVSKGSAATFLARQLKLKPENVMAVGDSAGDLPMLEAVGHPVVMAGASDALRGRYEVVAGDVERCGVVGALEAALKIVTV
jgi:Cof subfamily protein (haloacid dehalogenase superfamily)